jgi:hypothetical protein
MTGQHDKFGAESPRDRRPLVDTLLDHLFEDPETPTWAILDGSRIEQLVREIESNEVAHACLFAGELEPSLARVAPYLVRLEEEAPFTSWLLSNGWGRSWGVFVHSTASTMTLRRHFRRLLRVQDPAGKALLFRFYDPRVLRIYLPSCNAEETATVFGPVSAFHCESETGDELLRITPAAGSPATERIAIARRTIGG